MRPPAPLGALLLSATALLASSPGALAQSPAAEAQRLFDEATKLMQDFKPALACPKFEEAQRLDPGMATQFRLAECYEKTGRLAAAFTLFREVAAAARAAKSPERE